MMDYKDKLLQIRQKYHGDNVGRLRASSQCLSNQYPTIRGLSTIRQDADKSYCLDQPTSQQQPIKHYRPKQIDSIRDNYAQPRNKLIEDYTRQNKTIDVDREVGRIHHRQYTFNKIPQDLKSKDYVNQYMKEYSKNQLTQKKNYYLKEDDHKDYSKVLQKAYDFGKTLGYQPNSQFYKRPQLNDHKYDLPPRETYDYKYQQIKKDIQKDRFTDPTLNFGKQMTNLNDRIHSIASKYGYQYPETFSPSKKYGISTDMEELKVSNYLKSPIKIQDEKYKNLQLELRNRRTSTSAYGITKGQYHQSPVKKGLSNQNSNPEWGIKNMQRIQGKISHYLEKKQKY